MFRYFYVLLIVFLTGCTERNSKADLNNGIEEDTTTVEIMDLKALNFTDYSLDNKAKNLLSGWMTYTQVQEVAEELKKADLSYFKNDKEIVETTIKEFSETTPESINTDAVRARILVVQNMYLKLNNIINLDTSSKDDILSGIEDFLVAFSNLNFQINKKFERESQNIIKP